MHWSLRQLSFKAEEDPHTVGTCVSCGDSATSCDVLFFVAKGARNPMPIWTAPKSLLVDNRLGDVQNIWISKTGSSWFVSGLESLIDVDFDGELRIPFAR